MENIDVYWSFRSPYSYIAAQKLVDLSDEFNAKLCLRVVLPIAIRSKELVFSASNKNKLTYIVQDSMRFAEYLGLPIAFPKPDPIVQDMQSFDVSDDQPYIFRLSKLGVEAERRGKGIEFAAAASKLIWGGTQNWDQGDHLAKAAASAGLDLAAMEAQIEDGDHLKEVDENQSRLDAAGHWGVPTMVVRGEPFFGQDRIDVLKWRLEKLGLKKAK